MTKLHKGNRFSEHSTWNGFECELLSCVKQKPGGKFYIINLVKIDVTKVNFIMICINLVYVLYIILVF